MAIKHAIHKVTQKLKKDNERDARQAILEDLFYDFNRNRAQVYKMNFFRGIFLGVGTVIGGTVVIALLAWILSFFINIPGIGNQVEQIQQSIQNNKK
ncbi:MAG: hypothetical protein JWP06_503 [Candidatus Saccharibacteria bacterium]|nr:hypothetical protein [Candidatus Saccharibacteria bacterium]